MVTIGRSPDWALVEEFRALPEKWQAEVLLVIANRRPGLLEEAFGDVEVYRRTSADLRTGT